MGSPWLILYGSEYLEPSQRDSWSSVETLLSLLHSHTQPAWVPWKAGIWETWSTIFPRQKHQIWESGKPGNFISAALTCNSQQRKEWPQYKHLLFKVETVHVLQKQTCIAQRNSKLVYQEECELGPRLLVSKYPEVVFTILSCYLAVPQFLDL